MILVTGATGMTGQFVVQELQRRNVPVRALVREASTGKAATLGAEIAIGDLADAASLQRAMAGISGVAHVAVTNGDFAVEVAAMDELLNNWRDGPFVFVSTLDVYGDTTTNPVTEDHPLTETYGGDYVRGKIRCESMLTAKAAAAGRTDYTSVRAPLIFGPHLKAYERLKTWIPYGDSLLLPGTDEGEWSQYRDVWIDVRDLAWVIAELLEKPMGGPLNVLGDHFAWHDFYAELIRLSGSRCQILHKALAEMTKEEQAAYKGYAQTWFFDNTKSRHHLDFSPRYTLQQTLDDTFNVG